MSEVWEVWLRGQMVGFFRAEDPSDAMEAAIARWPEEQGLVIRLQLAADCVQCGEPGNRRIGGAVLCYRCWKQRGNGGCFCTPGYVCLAEGAVHRFGCPMIGELFARAAFARAALLVPAGGAQ